MPHVLNAGEGAPVPQAPSSACRSRPPKRSTVGIRWLHATIRRIVFVERR